MTQSDKDIREPEELIKLGLVYGLIAGLVVGMGVTCLAGFAAGWL